MKLGAISFCVLLLFGSDASGQASGVSIDVFVNNDYDDSNQSVADIESLLALRFFEEARPPVGQTLDEYLFDRYDFGPSQLPRSYAAIAAAVAEANRDHRHGEPYYVPAIPRRRSTRPGLNNPYHDVARTADFDFLDAQEGRVVVTQRAPTQERYNKGARFTLMRFQLPATVWEAIPEDARARAEHLVRSVGQVAIAEEPVAQVLPPPEPVEAAITVTEATTDVQSNVTYSRETDSLPARTNTDVTLRPATIVSPARTSRAPASAAMNVTEPDTTTETRADAVLPPDYTWPPSLQGLVPRRVTPLIVIDDGWPDLATARSSTAFVELQINGIRRKLALPPITIPSSASAASPHSTEIAEALAELTSQDVGGLVRVIYVPVVLTEETEPVHRALLHTNRLLMRLPANPWRDLQAVPPTVDAAALREADQLLAEWRAMTTAPAVGNDWVLRSDTLNAIYDIGQYAAESSGTVFVVNQSWDVRGGLYKLSPTDRSLTVAAAGKYGVDVIEEKLDFARRAATDEQFIAVMQTDHAGKLRCGSSKFPLQALPFARVVAFDGTLYGSQKCGTSFAAPRVAWAIAARFSAATTAPHALWHAELQRALRGLRSEAAPFRNILINDLSRIWQ